MENENNQAKCPKCQFEFTLVGLENESENAPRNTVDFLMSNRNGESVAGTYCPNCNHLAETKEFTEPPAAPLTS